MRFFVNRAAFCVWVGLALVAVLSPTPYAWCQDAKAANKSDESKEPSAQKASTLNPAAGGPSANQLEPPAKADPLDERATKPPTVVEQAPVRYVPDKEGRLVPLLGFTYEEILEFIRSKRLGQAAVEKPRDFSLRQLVINGQVQGNNAELSAEYTIELHDQGWIEVPLLKAGAVLREPAKYQGSGDQSVQFESSTGVYTARLRGEPRTEHRLTLKFIASIKSVGASRRLELDLPTAAASRLLLRTAKGPVELSDHSGCAIAEAKSLGRNGADGSEITLWGLGGPLSLVWQEGKVGGKSTDVLEADSQISARIDSRSVKFDALLTVRSFGAAFSRFQVRLPPKTRLTGDAAPPTAGYALTVSGQPDRQIVEVQLAQRATGPIEVRLQAERVTDLALPNEPLELAGFDVVEAAPFRQWGHIAVAVVGDWQAVWGDRKQVRQVAELPEALRRTDVVAGFEYLGQGSSLQVRLAPRKTRISVEPEYVYFVDSRQVRLEARLKYTIRGAKASVLELALPGWELDAVGPSNLVDSDAATAVRGQMLTLPLLQATSGELELTVKAHRDLPSDAARLELILPVPTADVVGPAFVALVPADEIRLRPRESEVQGLIRPTVPPRMKLPDHVQTPFYFRAEQPQATFVGDIERLPQAIRVEIDTTMNLQRAEIRVEQSFKFQIEREPASSLAFDVPRSLFEEMQWEMPDGQPLTAVPLNTENADSTAIPINLQLPQRYLGECEVVAKFRVARTGQLIEAGDSLAVPLAMPTGPSLQGNRLTMVGESARQLQPRDESWIAEHAQTTSMDGQRSAVSFSTSQFTPDVTLAFRVNDSRAQSPTTIERAWIQTWIAGRIRQDRAVYQLAGTADVLELTLPAGVAASNVQLKLDRQLLETVAADSKLKIRLPPGINGRPRVLELRYQFDNYTESPQSIEVSLPQFSRGAWVQRIYWQLVLPLDIHLISLSAELTPEFTWKWSGWGWSRRSFWEQSELENWIGATAEDAIPEATNRYLFSVAGSPSKFVAGAAPRWQIVGVASSLALVSGLLLMYFPSLRRPSALFVGSLMLVTLAASVPHASLLLAQAAGLGLVMIVIAGVLRRVVTGRRRLSTGRTKSGSSISERSSKQLLSRPLELAAASTTAGPADLEIRTSDSMRE